MAKFVFDVPVDAGHAADVLRTREEECHAAFPGMSLRWMSVQDEQDRQLWALCNYQATRELLRMRTVDIEDDHVFRRKLEDAKLGC